MDMKRETRSKAASSSESPKVVNLKDGQPPADKSVKLFKSFEANITSRLNSFEKTLAMLMNDVKEQLAGFSSQLSRIEEKFVKEFNDFKEEVNTKLNAFEQRMEAMERRSIASDVVLSGIPYVPGENVFQTVTTVSEALGVPDLNVVNVYRIFNYKKKPTSMIVARLPSTMKKTEFLRCFYSRLRGGDALTLRDIGCESDAKIYVNKCLTSRMYKIRRFAERLKRSGDIASVFTLNGQVYIRAAADDQPVKATSIEFLEMKLQRRRSV